MALPATYLAVAADLTTLGEGGRDAAVQDRSKHNPSWLLLCRLCIMESLTLQVHTKMVPRSQMASPSATVQSEFEYVFAPPSNAKLLRPVQLWAIGLPADARPAWPPPFVPTTAEFTIGCRFAVFLLSFFKSCLLF